MKNITRHTGILENVQQFDTSRNGNPRYTATVDGYSFYTGVDSVHGYSITNYEGKLVTVTLAYQRGKVTLQSIQKCNSSS